MLKLKNYFIFLILFICIFLYVGFCTNFLIKKNYIDISNYTINVDSPIICVEESKASYSKGYIKGFAINDTGEHIKDKYLQFDFYNKNGTYLGTKAQEIKFFNVGEKIKFDIKYEFRNTNIIKISFVDKINEIEPKKTTIWEMIKVDSITN